MENSIVRKNDYLKSGLAIKIFFIISCVIAIANYALAFYRQDFSVIILSSRTPVLKLIFYTILPRVIWGLYIFKFHGECKKVHACILLSIMFVLLMLELNWHYQGTPLDEWLRYILWDSFGESYWDSVFLYYLPDIIYSAPVIPIIISLAKGLNKKISFVLPVAIWLGLAILPPILLPILLPIASSLFLYCRPLVFIYIAALYISLLLFGWNNNLSATLPPEKVKAKINKMPPEKALELLKKNFDSGVFTEEEYQVQRAEIISKL